MAGNKIGFNTKRTMIDKANSRVVLSVAVAGFMVVFSFFACKALNSQRSYQSRVIQKKEKAVDQLTKNQQTVDKLKGTYQVFVGTSTNIIGGNPSGKGDKDGDNGKIILDALPSVYDYPALITSIEKLAKSQSIPLKSIDGQDDEIAQSGKDSKNKQPIEMPFKMTVELKNYNTVKTFLDATQRSIKPIKIKKLELSGAGNGQGGETVNADIEAVTFYQKAKGLDITKEVVK